MLTRVAAGSVVLAVLATAACTSAPSPSGTATGTETHAPSDAARDPAQEDGTGDGPTTPDPAAPPVVLSSGDVEIEVVSPPDAGVRLDPDGEGATTLTVGGGSGSVGLRLSDDVTFLANTDGTVTVLDAAGSPVGGLTAPRATGTGTRAGDARLVVVDARRVEIRTPDRATDPAEEGATSGTGTTKGTETEEGTGTVTVTTTLGTDPLRSAEWGENEGGRSLAVDPTAWARSAGVAGRAVLWEALVAAEPEAGTPGMHDQLVCHALGAPDKATWNLEPWRPDVGLVAVVAARCNPT
ncbi:DUF2599 domain-containing protein [Cellulosimicrobium marinum]|uniref:DUF2599 domain-containing protein n=1 Tax=Cellulosimicrobium marinum TaxID=1638992 RepID=UPI001E3F6228|nr:DUF2599 domain-containing protein [Cellulosimicrobium marinum]MCB7135165.1 DUF2599 domain-containing protein [Cellulosimicrobium marinum]